MSLSVERLKREFSGRIDSDVIEMVFNGSSNEAAARKILDQMVQEWKRAERRSTSNSYPTSLQDVAFNFMTNSCQKALERTPENDRIHLTDSRSQKCDPTDRPPEDDARNFTGLGGFMCTDGSNTLVCQGGSDQGAASSVESDIFAFRGAEDYQQSLSYLSEPWNYDAFRLNCQDSQMFSNEAFHSLLEKELNVKENQDQSETEENSSCTNAGSLELPSERKLSPEIGDASSAVPEDVNVDVMTDAELARKATVTETGFAGTCSLGVSVLRTLACLDHNVSTDLGTGSNPSFSEMADTEVSTISSLLGMLDSNDSSSECSKELSRRDSCTLSTSSLGLNQGKSVGDGLVAEVSSESSLPPSPITVSGPGVDGGTVSKPSAFKFTLSADAAEFIPREGPSSCSDDGSCPNLSGMDEAAESPRSPIGSGRSISLSPPIPSTQWLCRSDSHHQKWGLDNCSRSSPNRSKFSKDHFNGASFKVAQPKPLTPKVPSDHEKAKNDIASLVSRGSKVMVLMRGVPGSGKTTMAKYIRGKGQSYSADNFFMDNGVYTFDPSRLSDAHSWIQEEVHRGLSRAVNPVIVDNTNIETWEMAPYVRMALHFGYQVLIMEPTGVREKASVLAMRNKHGVSSQKIKEMQGRYRNITVDQVMKHVGAKAKFGHAVHDSVRRTGQMSDVTGGKAAVDDERVDVTWGQVGSTSTEPKPRRLKARSRGHQGGEGGEGRGTSGSCGLSVGLQSNENECPAESPKLQKTAHETVDEDLEKEIDTVRQSFSNPLPSKYLQQQLQKNASSPSRQPRKLLPSGTAFGTQWKGIYPLPAPTPLPPRPQHPVGAGSSRKSDCLMEDAETMTESGDFILDEKDQNIAYKVMTPRTGGRSIAEGHVAPEVSEVRIDNIHVDISTMTTDVSEMEYLYEMLSLFNPDFSREEIEQFISKCTDPSELLVYLPDLCSDNISLEDSENDDASASQGEKTASLKEKSMQVVMQECPISEIDVVRNLQEGQVKRQKCVWEFHHQHNIPQREEANALGAIPKLGMAAILSNFLGKAEPAAQAEDVQQQPRPASTTAVDPHSASEGTYILFPMSVILQLKKNFGLVTENAEVSDDKDVYVWMGRELGQKLLLEAERAMDQKLFAEVGPTEDWKQREAQLKLDEMFARKLQEEDETPSRGTLENSKQPTGVRPTDSRQSLSKEMLALLYERRTQGTEGGGWNKSAKQVPNLKDIMEEEQAASRSEQRENEEVKRMKRENHSFATITAHNRLYKDFPGIPQEVLDRYLATYEYSYEKASNAIRMYTNIQPLKPQENKQPASVAECYEAMEDANLFERWTLGVEVKNLQKRRNELANKAMVAYQRKQLDVASFWCLQAAKIQKDIRAERRKVYLLKMSLSEKEVEATNKLDLHGFCIQEALAAVESFLKKHEASFHIFGQTMAHDHITIVTGRGKHSPNGARLRPAILNYLQTSNYMFTEVNPGAICVSFLKKRNSP